MKKEKELLEELDLCYFSRQLFISNYKLLKKDRRECLKKMHEIRRKAFDGTITDFDRENWWCYELVLGFIYKSLNIAKEIINNGVTDELITKFYKSLVDISKKEGSDYHGEEDAI